MGFAQSFFSGAAGGATVAIILKAYDEYSSSLNKAQNDIKGFGKSSEAAMAAFGAAVVASEVAIFGLAIQAAKAENIGRAFNNMFGSKAPAALKELAPLASSSS